MLRYKLTNQNLQTYNGFQWEIGKKVTTNGDGELCSEGWLHCYSHPLLAVLLNPIHANISNPKIFEVECNGLHKEDYGLKEGFTQMSLLTEIKLPVVTTEQRIAFAILCSLEVYKDTKYVLWATNWLNGKDRSYAAANAAAYAANAAYAAANAAANTAYAAYAAANATANAANAAANAANAAYAAANTAKKPINLVETALKAMEVTLL